MNGNKAKKIATWIIVPLMISIFLLDILTVVLGNIYAKKYAPVEESSYTEHSDDRIHFLNTANSDCILLESNGRFAMIDSGEGNSNPRRKEPYHGFEETVISYIKKVAADEKGKVYLEFIMGTHYHYDHVGSFDAILKDEDITVGAAYFKQYEPKLDKSFEVDSWGLQDSYNTIVDDVISRGFRLVQTIPTSMVFGDFTLDFFNTGVYEDLYGRGENSASIGTRVTKGGKTAFLAADITKPSGVEDKLIGQIGHCDLLKIGHHGYFGSSSMKFLDEITPEIAIVPNHQGKVYPNVKWNLTMHAKVPFYGTYDYNGIIADFTDGGEIKLSNNIH